MVLFEFVLGSVFFAVQCSVDSKALQVAFSLSAQVVLLVLVVFVILAFGISYAGGTKAKILSNQKRCTALVEGANVLPFVKEDAFLMKLDLTVDLPAALNRTFVEDGEGKNCFMTIAKAFDSVLRFFHKKVMRIRTDGQILEKHLQITNPRKRSTGVAVAIVMGIVNLIVTGSTFVYNQIQFGELKERLMELEIQNAETTHQLSVFGNNAEFLFHENAFLGLSNNIVLQHLNVLQKVHACDVLLVTFDTCLAQLKFALSQMLDSIDSKKLTRHLIDHETLSELTLQPFFRGTVYSWSPYELYSKSRVFLRSFDVNEIVLIVAFPRIGLSYTEKVVEVVDTYNSVLLPHYGAYTNYLLPRNVSLDRIENNLNRLRPAINCISSQVYFSCQNDSHLSHMENECFTSLFAKEFDNSKCFSSATYKPLSIAYSKSGALIRSENGAKVKELTTGKTIFDSGDTSCFFLKDGKRLRVETPNGDFFLFTKAPVFSSSVFPSAVKTVFVGKKIKNFTLPENDNPFSYNGTSVLNSDFTLRFLHRHGNIIFVTIIVVSLSIVACGVISVICSFIGRRPDDRGPVNVIDARNIVPV